MAVTESATTNKTWELSLYELHRTPQEAVSDGTEIAVSPRSLHSELMCPICLDMLKSTMTTKECLHRFCQECIITALRSGNKECPTCRKKLVSKRSLRPDPNFDMLISKIYPSRDEYEAHQERVLAKLNKNHSTSLIHNIEEGLKLQAMNRVQRLRKNAQEEAGLTGGTVTPTAGTPGSSSDGGSQPRKKLKNASAEESAGSGAEPDPEGEPEASGDIEAPPEVGVTVNEVELVFKPHPEEENVDGPIRYIKTTANATVDHLCKYLALRLALDHKNEESSTETPSADSYQFNISVSPAAGQYTLLNGNQSLDQINEKHWKMNRPLEMFYSVKK